MTCLVWDRMAVTVIPPYIGGRDECSPEKWPQAAHHHDAAWEWVSCLPTTWIPQHRQRKQQVGTPQGLNWLCWHCFCVCGCIIVLNVTVIDAHAFTSHLCDTINDSCYLKLFLLSSVTTEDKRNSFKLDLIGFFVFAEEFLFWVEVICLKCVKVTHIHPSYMP